MGYVQPKWGKRATPGPWPPLLATSLTMTHSSLTQGGTAVTVQSQSHSPLLGPMQLVAQARSRPADLREHASELYTQPSRWV
jgi:hypothetical protein